MTVWLLFWLAVAQAIQFTYRLRPIAVQCFTEVIGKQSAYSRAEWKVPGYG